MSYIILKKNLSVFYIYIYIIYSKNLTKPEYISHVRYRIISVESVHTEE